MKLRTATLLLAVLATVPTAVAAEGPFHGAVRQGDVKTHHFDNNPQNNPCIQLIVTYTVTLTHVPTTDTLTLSAGGQTATSSGGVATVSFEASFCTAFDITVTGTDVENVARYTVHVSRGGGAVA
ncbi:MAG TPA: hypothetical protein VHH36_07365 [Candidatus Thermoplasmatota archaeon]|nr:hypothetical protein [Candidatus Thermoplasmatota archaeon]